MPTPGKILLRPLDEEMKESYLNYAMSVIVARALPDVKDGLKPVQRRILYTMNELSLNSNSPYKKSARTVGEVMAKYHPHGDSPIYEAMVRMAQEFSMRYPLVDGQGNFGSVDGDPPAAMRYTEARLSAIAHQMLTDIDLNTVNFVDNFDASLPEPTLLPAMLPNMLMNGASGIAVGMATNIPPHNLTEISNAVIELINNPELTTESLLKIVPGPDFPTGGIIKGQAGIIDAYAIGRGSIPVQARTDIEELKNGKRQIIVTELPYQVNKASLIEKIAGLIRDKKIDGVTDLRDESDRKGMRIVIELRRDVESQVILNNLFTHTAMRSSFNVITLALVNGQPEILGLKRCLQLYIEHRVEIITRRTQYLLEQAKKRLHIVEGLRIAINDLDNVIKIIRQAESAETARADLMASLTLSKEQAQAILDMQLRRFASLERQKLEDEYKALLDRIKELITLLESPTAILETIKKETLELKKKFGDKRRTEIDPEELTSFSIEDITPHEDIVLSLSKRGYIKRIPLTTYRQQLRGGKGVRGMTTREGDSLQDLIITDTHDMILLFSDKGCNYPLRFLEISADTSRTTKGTPIVNLLPLQDNEHIHALLNLNTLDQDGRIILSTKAGTVKSVDVRNIATIRSRGLNIMNLKKDDALVSVKLAQPTENALLITKKGMSIRFVIDEIRTRGRNAGGVRGIRLAADDKLIGMELIHNLEDKILLVTDKGYAKLVRIQLYRTQARGGKGIITFKTSELTGRLAAASIIGEKDDPDLIFLSKNCQVYRTKINQVPQQGRHTRGAIIWKGSKGDRVASVACFSSK